MTLATKWPYIESFQILYILAVPAEFSSVRQMTKDLNDWSNFSQIHETGIFKLPDVLQFQFFIVIINVKQRMY